MPQPAIAALLREHFVGLASDCDAPEDPVVALGMEHLADAMMLPFVMVVDGQGEFLAGSHGAVRPDRFQEVLEELTEGRKNPPPTA